ncbi:hypothetical protein F5Y16DRAFT_357760 [Xylariaceae sp. FL0255]|nr:hypothetical protein F5Y16DRAFT_357760 [Xylariaceae sp. FL0255]
MYILLILHTTSKNHLEFRVLRIVRPYERHSMYCRPLSTPTPLLGDITDYDPSAYPYDSRVNFDVDDKSSLIPPDLESSSDPLVRHTRYRVRIQGQIAHVRSVTVPKLRRGTITVPPERTAAGREDFRSGSLQNLVECDAQLRGYGIGGAGNIRRALFAST